MSRPFKPWFLPVTCAVIGVAWVMWLANGDEAVVQMPVDRPPSLQSAPRLPERSDKPDVSRPGAREASASAARVAEPLQSSGEPALRLDFQTPPTAQVGDGFDVRVAISSRKAIGRIVVEVAYDPAYLKVRTVEEIDYAQRALGERTFSSQQSSDGHVELILQRKRNDPPLALPASVPLVQFEAIAPGSAEVRIASISASDATDSPLSWSAAGREAQVVVN